MDEDFMAVVIDKLDLFAEVIHDIGSRLEALERIARPNLHQGASEPLDIRKPTILSYKEQLKLNALMKKDPEELR